MMKQTTIEQIIKKNVRFNPTVGLLGVQDAANIIDALYWKDKMHIPDADKQQLRIYISGKITGLPIDQVKPKFDTVEDTLQMIGHVPINPLKLHENTLNDWAGYMAHDLKILLTQADAIYMLHDWRDSRGARIEHFIAFEMGLQIFGHI